MKIFICIITAILSIFTLSVPPDPVCKTGYSVPVATDSVSTPKSNSINVAGTPLNTNLLGGVNNVYYAYTSNWATITDIDSTSRFTATGISLGPANGVDWIDTNPSAALVIWTSSYGSIPASVPITFTAKSNFTVSYVYMLQGSSNSVRVTPTQSETTYNGYYNYTFVTTQWTNHLEIRFRGYNTEYSTAIISSIYVGSFDTDVTIETTYNQGYNNGYEVGVEQGTTDANNTVTQSSASYQAGVQQGTTDGYNSGYQAGVQQGTTDANNTVTQSSASYQAGYNAGQNSGDTFYKMVVSVLDAPVQIFLDTFNFEIFGINASNIILSLFTLALITFIIKLLI